jgi:hypothetical protein
MPHKWGERVPLDTGTERTCQRCGLVKITIHPPHGFPWIEWRKGTAPQIQLSTTPPCVPAEEPIAASQ